MDKAYKNRNSRRLQENQRNQDEKKQSVKVEEARRNSSKLRTVKFVLF